MQKLQKRILVWVKLLQRIAFESGHNTGDQPTRLADLDHGDHCRVLFKCDKASAEVVLLCHGGAPSLCCCDDGAIASPRSP
jgi:hypothetical protein